MLGGVWKFLRRTCANVKRDRTWKRLRRDNRHHAFPQVLDWDWKQTPYNRIALVTFLAGRLGDPRYLEIGCFNDRLFDSVPASDKTGVDPAAGGTLRMTSDAFFETGPDRFDLVFIDGLHTYDQVRRDVVNAIAHLNPGGVVALHDLLPRGWKEAHVPRLNKAWNGDVWKVSFELAETPGIDFRIVRIDNGVGVFRVTGGFQGLTDRRAELAERQFDYFHANLDKLPLIDWAGFVAWAGAKPAAD